MRTPRVFLKTELKANSILELDQNISDHLKVTNKKIGQQLQLFDGQGNSTFGNIIEKKKKTFLIKTCLLYTSPSPRDKRQSRMPSSA